MGFTVSDAGDKFLVGVFSNPPTERTAAVPAGLLSGWQPWEHSAKLRTSDKLLAPQHHDALIQLIEWSPLRAGCFTILSLPLSVEAPLPQDSEGEGSPVSPSCVLSVSLQSHQL